MSLTSSTIADVNGGDFEGKSKPVTSVKALTEVTGLDLPSKSPPFTSAIVLDVSDIDDIIAEVKNRGLTCYREDHLVTQDGREGREYGFLDYDGNLIVIYKINK